MIFGSMSLIAHSIVIILNCRTHKALWVLILVRPDIDAHQDLSILTLAKSRDLNQLSTSIQTGLSSPSLLANVTLSQSCPDRLSLLHLV